MVGAGRLRRRRRHGGPDVAELRADRAQGGELRGRPRGDGRHPLRALDAPGVVQRCRRARPTPAGPLVSNRFFITPPPPLEQIFSNVCVARNLGFISVRAQ